MSTHLRAPHRVLLIALALFATLSSPLLRPAAAGEGNGVTRGGGDFILTRFLMAVEVAELGLQTLTLGTLDPDAPAFKVHQAKWLQAVRGIQIEVGNDFHGVFMNPAGQSGLRYQQTTALYRESNFFQLLSHDLRSNRQTTRLYVNSGMVSRMPMDIQSATESILRAAAESAGFFVGFPSESLTKKIVAAGLYAQSPSNAPAFGLIPTIRGRMQFDPGKVRAAYHLAKGSIVKAPRIIGNPLDSHRDRMIKIFSKLKLDETIQLTSGKLTDGGMLKAALAAIVPKTELNLLYTSVSYAHPTLSALQALNTSDSGNVPFIYLSLPYLRAHKPSVEEIATLLIHEVGHLAGFVGSSSHSELDRYATELIETAPRAFGPPHP